VKLKNNTFNLRQLTIPYTHLADCLRRQTILPTDESLGLIYINSLKPSIYFYVPPGLTSTNYTFCLHSVFMCFMWISEQTAIISLYRIN
jgi:hypothetical protein